jgi:hypothetical protein
MRNVPSFGNVFFHSHALISLCVTVFVRVM